MEKSTKLPVCISVIMIELAGEFFMSKMSHSLRILWSSNISNAPSTKIKTIIALQNFITLLSKSDFEFLIMIYY